MLKKRLLAALVMSTFCLPITSYAQNLDEASQLTEPSAEDGVVIYSPDFFVQYFPVTALDFVNRVPGFSIDQGGGVRGFGGAAGNVLIDGERPSTKSDSIRNILSRIGKDSVERIELIRGATGGLDLGGGQSVVVNVVRKADAGGTIPWRVRFQHDGGRFTPRGNVAYTDKYKDTDYTISLEREAAQFRNIGFEDLITTVGPDEFRDEIRRGKFSNWILDIKTDTKLPNE
jgi:outer membrane receptor protein involved in Fe transport